MEKYTGHCECDAVEFECVGEPLFTQNCHCNKCREVAEDSKREDDKKGYSFTAAYLTSNFTITSGNDKLESITKRNAELFRCTSCKCLIYGISLSEEAGMRDGIGINANNFDILGTATVPDSFQPVRHVYYANRKIDMTDDLPKFINAPENQNGDGKEFIPDEDSTNTLSNRM